MFSGLFTLKSLHQENNCYKFNKEENITIVPTERGGEMLLRNGYKYTKRADNKGKQVWRCANRKSSCKAVLYTDLNLAVIKETQHVCEADEIGIKVKEIISVMIRRAKNETTPMPRIYSEVIAEYGDEYRRIPSFDKMKNTLYRHRKK